MSKNTRILVVEDSLEDFEAIKRSLGKAGLINEMDHCDNGDDALDFLFKKGKFTEAEEPGLVLLDLNLPGVDGREILQKIKTDENLKKIPVVVLTTSNDPRDVEQCYNSGANSYICKPVDFDGFMRSLQALEDYWFRISILPKDLVNDAGK